MELCIFTEPQQGATYDQLRVHAQLVEELGYDGWFRSDHYLHMGDVNGLPGPTDAWITLAGLARDTSRVRLGTLVTPATFRHPGPLAITVAQVDAMSGGRVDLGMGAGWFEEEHLAYGIPFPPWGERFDRLEEQLAVITGLWGVPEGERWSHAGVVWPVVDSPGRPKPVQQPHPPIIIGGAGPRRTPRIVARYADEFNLMFARAELGAEIIGRMRAACEADGRDPASLRVSAAITLVCGRDRAEQERRAKAIGREVDELRENHLCGTPAEVVEGIAAYHALGAERMYVQILDLADDDHLHLVAAEVLPGVAAL